MSRKFVKFIKFIKSAIDKRGLLRYLLGSMISSSFGIKQFQSNLPSLANKMAEVGGHYLVTKRGKPVFMAIPFEDYQEIQDIIDEAQSRKLLVDIEKGRQEYKEGKTRKLEEVMAEIDDK